MSEEKKVPGGGGGSSPPPSSNKRDPLQELEKQLKGLSVTRGVTDDLNDLKGYISTGCIVMDAYMGRGMVIGGYPMGRFTELYGVDGSGKTTLGTAAMISCQQGRGTLLRWVKKETEGGRPIWVPEMKQAKLRPGIAILIDSEFKWPLDKAQRAGLDPERLLRLRPPMVKKKKGGDAETKLAMTIEDCLRTLDEALDKIMEMQEFRQQDVPILVVWDSLAASPTEAEVDGYGLAEGVASKARKVREAMRKFTGKIAGLGVTVLVINQVYDKIGMKGTTASGGRGLKFHASHRMKVWQEAQLFRTRSTGEKIGIVSRVQVEKSSICPPTFSVSVPLLHESGIDDDRALVEFFLQPGSPGAGLIKNRGPYYYISMQDGSEVSFQYAGLGEFLRSRPEIRTYLVSCMMKAIRGSK